MKPIPFAAFVAVLAIGSSPPGVRASEPVVLDGIGSACLETRLGDCRVLTAGFINADDGDNDGAPRLAWQTQAGFTPEDGVLGGFVLFAHEAAGWEVLDAAFEGWRYAPPVVNEEAGLLHVAGYTGGTGAGNVDRLYQWGDLGYAVYRAGWRRIEMHAWQETIGDMLPDGLEIWKGVEYDIRGVSDIVARTPLWRATDGNCCPTGGDAIVTLEITDDRLVATGVRHLPPPDGRAP